MDEVLEEIISCVKNISRDDWSYSQNSYRAYSNGILFNLAVRNEKENPFAPVVRKKYEIIYLEAVDTTTGELIFYYELNDSDKKDFSTKMIRKQMTWMMPLYKHLSSRFQ